MATASGQKAAKRVKPPVPSAIGSPERYHCYFRVEGRLIAAQRHILSEQSDVFAAKFDGDWAGMGDITIDDSSFDAFSSFVEYFYSGQIDVSMTNVAAIMHLADKFAVERLIGVCSKFLCANARRIGGAIVALELAVRYELGTKHHFLDTINRNAVAAFGCTEFLRCDKATLHEMLDGNGLCCDQETIFDNCIRWAQHKCTAKRLDASCALNIRRELDECFGLIDFRAMQVEAFIRRYNEWNGVFRRSEGEEVLLYICRNQLRQIEELRALSHS